MTTESKGEALDLNKLEALAKAATPGPWHITSDDRLMTGKETVIEGSAEGDGYFPHTADGQFVAAANPAAILELIALARAGSAAPTGPQAKTIADIQAARIKRLEEQQNGFRPDFLLNGTRFKLNFSQRGNVDVFHNYAAELQGRWVALVPAEDDCHLAAPLPTKEGAGEVDAARWQFFVETIDEAEGKGTGAHLTKIIDEARGKAKVGMDAIRAAIAAQPKDTTDTTKEKA